MRFHIITTIKWIKLEQIIIFITSKSLHYKLSNPLVYQHSNNLAPSSDAKIGFLGKLFSNHLLINFLVIIYFGGGAILVENYV